MVHLAKVDLNLFVVFSTIFTEGGITRASERLHLSQPAISHALGRLRQMFDDPLFERSGNRMIPTATARQLIEPIRRALLDLEYTLAKTSSFDPATAKKTFTIGMRDVLEATVLPYFLERIGRSAPGIDFNIVSPERKEMERELAAGTLDAVIDVPLQLPLEVRRQRVAGERLIVVGRRNHPGLRGRLSLDRYLLLEHIAISSRRHGLTAEDFELSRLNLQRRIRLRARHYYAACHTVSKTDLVLTMPERYARIINTQFGNRLLSFPLATPAYSNYLYWHAQSDSDPANIWLRKQLSGTSS